jgi:Right handed beta helix region
MAVFPFAMKEEIDAVEARLDSVELVMTSSSLTKVRAAATGNVNISSPGASIDGVTLASGNRVLLPAQSTGSQNGIYVFNGAASAMTRATDFNDSAEMKPGLLVVVEEGTANKDSLWELETDGPITLGTTALVFVAKAGGAAGLALKTYVDAIAASIGAINVSSAPYSVVGDGSGNKATGINAALTAAGNNAVNNTGPTDVYIGPGDYPITATVTVPANVRLWLTPQTRIYAAAAFSPMVRLNGSYTELHGGLLEDNGNSTVVVHGSVVAQAAHYNDIVVESTTINCTHGNSWGIGIWGSDRVRIENNTVTNWASTTSTPNSGGKGIALWSDEGDPVGSSAYWIYGGIVRGNYVYGWHRGFDSYGTSARLNLTIESNYFEGAKHYGIHAYHTCRSSIVNNIIHECENGLWSDSGSDPFQGSPGGSPANRVIGNRITDCVGHGILTEEFEGVISGNSIHNCGTDGIVLGGGTHSAVVSGNSITYNDRDGIVCNKHSNPNNFYLYDININGNTIRHNGRHGVSALGVQRNCTIASNSITDNGASTTGYGVYLAEDSAGGDPRVAHITGNTIGNNLNNSAGAGDDPGNQLYGVYADLETGSHLVLQGNHFHTTSAITHVYSRSGLVWILGNFFAGGTPLDVADSVSLYYEGNAGGALNGVSGGAAFIQTQTYTTGTLTIDARKAAIHHITLQANVSAISFTTPTVGQKLALHLIQDATGGRTVTWPGTVKFAGAAAPTDTTASRRTILELEYDGTNWYELRRSVAVG